MAATGKTPILLYGSTTATNQPSAGNLTNSSDGCEIAINVTDKNLFFKDNTNTVNTVPIRQSSASSNGWLSSTDWSTFNGKQPAGSYANLSGGNTFTGTQNINGTLNVTDGTRILYVSSRSSVAGSGLRIGTDIASTDNSVNIAGGLFTGTTSGGVNISYYSNATGVWNAAISVLNTASTYSTLNLMPDGGDASIGNGNLVIGTSGKGIDFSATAGTGTSELLADYEEGTFTPVINQGFNAPITYTTQTGKYTKIGNTVYYSIYLYMAAGLTPNTDLIIIGGLPYTVGSVTQAGGTLGYCSNVVAAGVPLPITYLQSTVIALYTTAGAAFAGTNLAGARPEISVFGFYQV